MRILDKTKMGAAIPSAVSRAQSADYCRSKLYFIGYIMTDKNGKIRAN